MDSPLWTSRHAPTLSELPQERASEYLERAAAEPINLIVQGPVGSGKTAAARAMARAAHADPDNDVLTLNVADFFDRTKSDIRSDPRFEAFLSGQTEFSKQYRRAGDRSNKYKRQWSKREMLAHVLKEYASYAPATGSYKTLILDNVEAVREDFQHALRRIVERHHETTQFVLTTRQPSKLIPPIRSRCFPVHMRAPTSEEITDILAEIVAAEGVAAESNGLAFVAGAADGNVREAILAAQTVAAAEGEITMDAAYEVLGEIGLDEEVSAMLEAAESGAFTDARSTLDDLLIDEGLDGSEVLESILAVSRSRYRGAELARLYAVAGEVDFDMHRGTNRNDRIHVGRLLAELGRGAEA